jgi:hypothetical protein
MACIFSAVVVRTVKRLVLGRPALFAPSSADGSEKVDGSLPMADWVPRDVMATAAAALLATCPRRMPICLIKNLPLIPAFDQSNYEAYRALSNIRKEKTRISSVSTVRIS